MINVQSLGDSAIAVSFGNEIAVSIHQRVKALTSYLDENPIHGMIEYVPSFTSVTIYYNPLEVIQAYHRNNGEKKRSAFEIVSLELKQMVKELKNAHKYKARKMEIPACYGGDFGPDLDFVARHSNLTRDEVITIHSAEEYLVYMIGFAPGFPFIGGMSERIATPRRKEPRFDIPPGSVGIAGKQTGIYPISTPGGWRIIARTPLKLFLPEQTPPSLLQAGDIITFKPISIEEYREYKEKSP